MADTSLLTLPVEIVHRIFDHCDVQNLLSIRCVCKRLYILASAYDRFKLIFNLESPYNVEIDAIFCPARKCDGIGSL